MKKKKTNIIIHIILMTFVICTLFPIFYTLISSLKTNMEILTEPTRLFPKKITFDNYITAWTSEEFNVPKMLFNSLYYTVTSVISIVLISTMAGYVFARGEFPGKTFLFACFSTLLFVQSTGVGIYPKFEILRAIHLDTGLNALVILGFFAVPITYIYIVKGFVASIPRELDESAEIDGCSFMGTFFRIIQPLLLPTIATTGILTFRATWNSYVDVAIFTSTKPEQQTLMVGLMALKSSSGAATNWALMMAGSIIALVPVVGAYLIGNKYMIAGLTSGAVKG